MLGLYNVHNALSQRENGRMRKFVVKLYRALKKFNGRVRNYRQKESETENDQKDCFMSKPCS